MHTQHHRRRTSRLLIVAAIASAAFAISTGSAYADNAPPQACGNTQPGPCTETDHFTNEAALQTPLGEATNATTCPSWLVQDYVLLDMSGNGIEHVTVNKAQDFWFTTTFTGTGTASFYPASSLANVVTDDQGNITSFDVVGPSDSTVTGHLTNWFGGSGNNRNAVFHGTITLTGTDQNGQAVTVHDTQHSSWTGTQQPFVDPPHTGFNDITC